LKKTLLILSLLPLFLSAQNFQNVMISNMASPNEPSICINPKHPNQICAGANLNSIYLSNDYGYTWTRTLMSSSFGVWGDPCIVADTTGAFYFFHLSNSSSPNGWIDRLVCQRLDSTAAQWTSGVGFGLNGSKDQDKEWVAVNPNNNELYCTWTQFDTYGSTSTMDSSIILFSKSADRGNSWSAPLRISKKAGDCIDGDNTTEGAVPAIGPNNEVYVAWANQSKIYFNKSVDNGQTWLSNEVFVSTQVNGWDYNISGINRCNGLPITSCDRSSGSYNGNIYVNWTDNRNGNYDVFVSKSSDAGNTWSSPIKVNTDNGSAQQFFSWMTIDQSTGYVYFIYYDRRNFAVNSDSTDVYMSVSTDGCNSFTDYKINSSSFKPTAGSFIGDYTNISAEQGFVRPIWTRMQNGSTSIYTAIIDSSMLINTSSIEPTTIETECASAFYDESPFIAYKLRRNAKVSIRLYDFLGKQVAIIKENEMTPYGKYVIHLNKQELNLTCGAYVCTIKTDDKMQTVKIIFQ